MVKKDNNDYDEVDREKSMVTTTTKSNKSLLKREESLFKLPSFILSLTIVVYLN